MTNGTRGWWTAVPREPAAGEVGRICLHCRNEVRARELVKQCPECELVLHVICYGDTEGGRAYQTEGCESCRHRCYWR